VGCEARFLDAVECPDRSGRGRVAETCGYGRSEDDLFTTTQRAPRVGILMRLKIVVEVVKKWSLVGLYPLEWSKGGRE
jgi:hypothetical protein